ncbi:hypothetical protein F5H01DRAFT_399372 [Linnemannia elongata]|nr:hypothetical protein F5H01DRAFT_399372 [Linnemannia elongata]
MGKEEKEECRLKVSLLGGMKGPAEKSNCYLDNHKEPSNNRDKGFTPRKDTNSIQITVSNRTRKGLCLILMPRSALIAHLDKLDRIVNLVDLDTDQEQGRKEHQDGTGVLVRDKGFLAPDGVDVGGKKGEGGDGDRVVSPVVLVVLAEFAFIGAFVYRGDHVSVEGDDDDEVHQRHEGHPEAQAEDRGGHVNVYVRFGWSGGRKKEGSEREIAKREKWIEE